MLWRNLAKDLAKVGVEGSNPFARSSYLKELMTRSPIPLWESGS